MESSLDKSRKLANSLRFKQDRRRNVDYSHTLTSDTSLLLESGLLITPEMLPVLDDSIVHACNKLHLERKRIEAFVLNEKEPNAYCYRYDTDMCRIAITSGLVELLEKEEMAFIVGHEIGHFLLDHVFEKDYTPHPANQAFLQESRSREISADRIGLWASGSVEASLRAMIKTQCGLPSNFIRFDISEFIGMLRDNKVLRMQTGTHPNFYMRARFVLWASFLPDNTKTIEYEREKTDTRIIAELDRFMGRAAREHREEVIRNLDFWLNVSVASIDGVLSKDEQKKIKDLGYSDDLQRLSIMLSGMSNDDVRQLYCQRIESFMNSLKEIDRDGGKDELDTRLRKISDRFGVSYLEAKKFLCI